MRPPVGASAAVGASVEPDDVAERVRRVCADVADVDVGTLADARMPVAALPLDSLRRVELLGALEAEFGVTLPSDALGERATLRDVAHVVAARRAARDDADDGATLPRMLADAARRGGTCAVIHEHGAPTIVTFAELEARALQMAGALGAAGVRRGDRVGLVVGAPGEAVSVFFGVVALGAVAVPLAPPPEARQADGWSAAVAARLAQVRATAVVDTAELPSAVRATFRDVRVLDAVDVVRDAAFRSACARPDDLALLQFSSGTGGAPKPVALTHRQLRANVDAAASRARMTGDDAFVSWLPLYHDMGLIGGVLTPIGIGASLTLIAPQHFLRTPAVWLRAISDARATISLAPSFGYAHAARRVADRDCEGLDLRSWRLAWNGAEPVRPSVIAAFGARFARHGWRQLAMLPTYGLAEAALCVTCPEPNERVHVERVDPQALRAGRAVPTDGAAGLPLVSVGRALPGFAVRIATAAAARADGEVGEIQVRGPSVMHGYDGDPDATVAAFDDGWLRTGDLGYLRDGRLFVCGRIKDTVIVRGTSFLAVELEAAVEVVAETRSGRALVFDDATADGDPELVVVAEVRTGVSHGAARHAIRASLHARLGVVPDRVVLVPPRTLPVTTSGKLRRQAVRARYGRVGRSA